MRSMGQGAVESPLGWLIFMCWLSKVVDMNSPESIPLTNNRNGKRINKCIYADDGTYMQRTREAAQTQVDAVAKFAMATGIIIKPTKSYVYSTTKGKPITVEVYERKDKKPTHA